MVDFGSSISVKFDAKENDPMIEQSIHNIKELFKIIIEDQIRRLSIIWDSCILYLIYISRELQRNENITPFN